MAQDTTPKLLQYLFRLSGMMPRLGPTYGAIWVQTLSARPYWTEAALLIGFIFLFLMVVGFSASP